MTNKEILDKVFEKAKIKKVYRTLYGDINVLETSFANEETLSYSFHHIIFSHPFAKAFWGEDDLKYYLSESHSETKTIPSWQYHLQQMVLEENPLKYLERFL